MTLIKPFGEISKNDAAIAGGKGASLGEMTQAGIQVPPGFVVLSSSFDRFLEETDLLAEIDTALHTVNREEMHTVEQASQKIQQMILGAKMPDDIARDIEKNFKELGAEYVAVRSSATAEDSASAAWAGQLDSYLNTTKETLLTNVQRCWTSLFTPRAIFYRFEKNLHTQKISVAVVVQKMVASEVSGIAFSVHPVTEDYNQLIIEAGFGLGEAIVSGQVTPDSYVVEKAPRRIIDTNVSSQTRALYRASGGGNEWKDIPEPRASSQVLTEKQVLELSELILKIENHYGFPCDIEWAFEGSTFYIVQSRPITTLSQKSKAVIPAVLEKYFTRELSLYEAVAWRDGNCKTEAAWAGRNTEEALFIRPDTRDLLYVYYSQYEFDIYEENVVKKASDPQWFPQVTKTFNVHWKVMLHYLTKKEPLTREEFRDYTQHFFEWWAPMVVMFITPDISALPQKIRDEALALRAETQEYSDKSDELYLKTVKHLYPHMAEYAYVLTPEEATSGNFPPTAELQERLKGWYLTNDSFGLLKNLPKELQEKNWQLGQTTLSKVYSREKALFYFSLWDLCDREGIKEFLGEEINANLFIERGKEKQGDVWYSQKELGRLSKISIQKLHDDANLRLRVVEKMEKSWAKAAQYLSGSQKLKSVDEMYSYYRHIVDFWSAMNTVFFELPNNPDLQPDFRESILKIREETEQYTDKMSSNFVEFWETEFPEYAKFSYVITPEEAVKLAKHADKELIATLEQRYQEGCFLIKGDIWPLSKLEQILKEKNLKLEQIDADGAKEIKGQTAYPGKVAGTVRLVMNKKEIAKIGVGDVLVAPMTNPEYVPYMQKAAAFITDEGGLTCHAAIVSREMKKPCIVGTKIATEVLKDGDLVEVDADNGIVRILNARAEPEFVFAFSAQGTPFLFEDVVNEGYMPVESAVLGHGGKELSYWEKKTTEEARDIGLRRTPADTKEVIASLTALVEQGLGEIKMLRQKKEIARKDAEHVFTLISKICGQYAYFDYMYWDKVFERSATDPAAKENVALVESFKNEIRERMEKIFFGADSYLQTLVAKVAKQRSLTTETVNWYRGAEVLALFGGTHVSEQALEARTQAWVLHKTKGGVEFLVGDAAQRFIAKVENVGDSIIEVLTGKTAHTGPTVRGKVRKIIRDYSNREILQGQMHEMQKGEILVSDSTDPELIEAFKKAAAVVTDAGGMLSHAAITAREMGIPCIVETGFATKILNNGDEIEVDTKKGTVAILKRSHPFGSKDEWQRLFRVQGLRYFIDDIWMEHYQTLGALTTVIDDFYTSYLSHTTVQKTLAEGARLISDAADFTHFQNAFRAYMKEIRMIAESLAYSKLSKEEVERLLNDIARLFFYYSKTEFFYMDGAYKKSKETKDKGIEERLSLMGELKNEGREFLNSIFFGADAVLPKLLKSLGERFNISERTLQQYSRQEILNLFDAAKVPEEEIAHRENAFYIIGVEGSTVRKTGPSARHAIESFVGNASHGETVTGTTAHPGIARGRARIIVSGYDNFDTLHHLMDAMQKGDILIAETTSPELMPACKKAGGIITDQGGMLSHAAIVSRELNIPCIVGTGNASEVIKDGDEIEMDANTGIVTILK